MKTAHPIPVIDLFAGPGGLGEGFSSVLDHEGQSQFEVRLSIEKDPVAHRTLSLRSLYRALRERGVPDCYYDYVKGKITREELFTHPDVPAEARHAALEARCAELGKTPDIEINKWICEALGSASDWVLIGGPPCQAYSTAGRSRMRSADPKKFEKDERHFLYEQYLRILRDFAPPIFVMENVKGILTSRIDGELIFNRILSDLQDPGNGYRYEIRSFVKEGTCLDPHDYVIHAENYGLPQARHRVILFGVRTDRTVREPKFLSKPGRFILSHSSESVAVKQVLAGMPPLRSKLSREKDSHEAWLRALQSARLALREWKHPKGYVIEQQMTVAYDRASEYQSFGGAFVRCDEGFKTIPENLRLWLEDSKLGGMLQHEARSHMQSDLWRYIFAASFADVKKRSPKIQDFPPMLLPRHSNIHGKTIPFSDRFRVQLADRPSTTIVSHIAKDGHYYIHFDAAQCRSLTVREAARLQTFPDNYYFEGNRTQQYWQVGNAVPPYLAFQIGHLVSRFLGASRHELTKQEIPTKVHPKHALAETCR